MKAHEFYADLALEHEFRERECGDHTIESCRCGYNAPSPANAFEPDHEHGLHARHVREVFEKSAKHFEVMTR